jgi:hypothetical protein
MKRRSIAEQTVELELEYFELVDTGNEMTLLRLAGRWVGVDPRRLERPSLVLNAGGSLRRLPALPDNGGRAGGPGTLWRAAFGAPTSLAKTGSAQYSLDVGLRVDLPRPVPRQLAAGRISRGAGPTHGMRTRVGQPVPTDRCRRRAWRRLMRDVRLKAVPRRRASRARVRSLCRREPRTSTDDGDPRAAARHGARIRARRRRGVGRRGGGLRQRVRRRGEPTTRPATVEHGAGGRSRRDCGAWRRHARRYRHGRSCLRDLPGGRYTVWLFDSILDAEPVGPSRLPGARSRSRTGPSCDATGSSTSRTRTTTTPTTAGRASCA